MRNLFLIFAVGLVQAVVPPPGVAQQWAGPVPYAYAWMAADPAASSLPAGEPSVLAPAPSPDLPSLVDITPMPRMAPELALATFERHLERQPLSLAAYSATQVIEADLPDTRQKGEWELQRFYVAPKSLSFRSLKFLGDGFVKTNVIARLLKTEVEHVEKDDPGATALDERNYKFKYKGVDEIDGQPTHVFEVKPRKKRLGLIKGKIYLDVHTGALQRVTGQLAKSPSFFIKKLEFVQEYAQIGGFTLPVHTRSTAKTRIVGRAVVDITWRDYIPVGNTTAAAPSLRPVSLTSGNE